MDVRHHVDRMRQELDMAYRADDSAASTAHFGLAALHLAEIERASKPESVPAIGIQDQQLRQLSRYYW